MANTTDVRIGDEIDIAIVVLDDQYVLSSQHMVASGNGIRNILRHFHRKWEKGIAVKEFNDLVFHCYGGCWICMIIITERGGNSNCGVKMLDFSLRACASVTPGRSIIRVDATAGGINE